MTSIPLQLTVKGRSCKGCTKCCEGWLSGEIRGQLVSPGNPCNYVVAGAGCSEYENRPKNPCKDFFCEWVTNPDVPDDFSPKNINTILVKREQLGLRYYQVVEAGDRLDALVLTWAIRYCISKGYNLYWTVDSVPFYLGDEDYVSKMNEIHGI